VDRKEVEYLQGLLEIFKVEAQEHTDAMANGLIELEKAGPEKRGSLVEEIYREAHSLKGAARAVNMDEVEGLCQRLETVFSEMKRQDVTWSPALFDVLHRATSELDAMLQSPHSARSVAETARTQELYQALDDVWQTRQNATQPAVPQTAAKVLARVTEKPAKAAPPPPKGVSTEGVSSEPPAPAPVAPKKRPEARAKPVDRKPSPASAAPPSPAPAPAVASPPADPAPEQVVHSPSTPPAAAKAAEPGDAPAVQPAKKAPAPQPVVEDRGIDTIRVSTAKLDALLLQAEELLSARLTAGYRAAEVRDLAITLAGWSKEWTKLRSDVLAMQQIIEGSDSVPRTEYRVPSESYSPQTSVLGTRYAVLRNLLEFLNWNQSFVRALESRIAALNKAAEHDQSALAGMTDTLLDDMKKVLMLPFASLLETFPRIARELARSRGKDVDLIIRGGEIEIDRRILEALKDPLIHLVRNSIDHGIEAPEERVRAGKPERGTLTITVEQSDANKIEVLVADDGAGIDARRVLAAAMKSGLVSEAEAGKFDEAAAQSLVFKSGFSTSPIITDLSGRGLGLAIVREKVEKLGGTVGAESTQGKGTLFRLVLPLTLATRRGILVQSGGRFFVLPTTHVERVVSVRPGEIKTVGGRETFMLDGEAVSLARLADSLGLPATPGPAKTSAHERNGNARSAETRASAMTPAVVLRAGDRRIAFIVDAIIDEQEVLVKSLGPQLVHVPNVSGATVLGNGKVVPILNVVDLLRSSPRAALDAEELGSKAPVGRQHAAEAKKNSILVAEDSITSRTLLKNILEAAGYSVKTAIDGADALAELRTTTYDLLVSDVEMPRMNGFDLVARVRSDETLKDLPVVLVTSLESREDRERGAEVGANAYLVKRGFDQASLLEVIRRLI
jgi:two-component system, chemotaxis family, sensor kinase CheA